MGSILMFMIIWMIIITVVVCVGLRWAAKIFEVDNLIVYAVWGLIAFVWFLVAISCLQRIDPGEVGVVVDLFGSQKGVEQEERTVGYHFIQPWQTLYTFPIFEQNHQWINNEGFSFQTSEGLAVHADIGITFHLQPDKIHELFAKYRRGMDEITHLFIRNNLRDAINRSASKLKIEELYGPGKEEFFKDILDQVKVELEPLGFSITHLYIIGQFNVPDTIKQALNAKIEAIQRAQQRENELREAEAQARKEVAIVSGEAQSKLIKAEADSKANRLISMSLTKELLEWEAVKKWDGKLPHAFGGGKLPFIMQIDSK